MNFKKTATKLLLISLLAQSLNPLILSLAAQGQPQTTTTTTNQTTTTTNQTTTTKSPHADISVFDWTAASAGKGSDDVIKALYEKIKEVNETDDFNLISYITLLSYTYRLFSIADKYQSGDEADYTVYSNPQGNETYRGRPLLLHELTQTDADVPSQLKDLIKSADFRLRTSNPQDLYMEYNKNTSNNGAVTKDDFLTTSDIISESLDFMFEDTAMTQDGYHSLVFAAPYPTYLFDNNFDFVFYNNSSNHPTTTTPSVNAKPNKAANAILNLLYRIVLRAEMESSVILYNHLFSNCVDADGNAKDITTIKGLNNLTQDTLKDLVNSTSNNANVYSIRETMLSLYDDKTIADYTGFTKEAIEKLTENTQLIEILKPYFETIKAVYDALSTSRDNNYQYKEGYTVSPLIEDLIDFQLDNDKSPLEKQKSNPIYILYSKYHDDVQNDALSNLSNSQADVVVPDTIVQETDITDGVLSILSNARIENRAVTCDDGIYNLSDVGYILLAAGSIYDPFVSKAGDEAYVNVVQEFLTSNQHKTLMSDAIQRAVTNKKPLLVTKQSDSTKASENLEKSVNVGTYQQAILTDLTDPADNTTYIFATAKGELIPSQIDGNTWEFVNPTESQTASTTSVSVEPTVPTTTTGEEDEDTAATVPTTEVYTEPTSMYLSDGTLNGAQKNMTSPIAYSHSPVGSKSVLKQNNEIDRMGLLTTMIVNNAYLDCKNSAISDLTSSVSGKTLYVNGLGDIVLADGTIVLPAISNPALYSYDFGTTEITTGYYPYTSAFSSHYPNLQKTSFLFVIRTAKGDASDSNKYGIFILDKMNNNMIIRQLTQSKITNPSGLGSASDLTLPPIAWESLSLTSDNTLKEKYYTPYSASGIYLGIDSFSEFYTQLPALTSSGISLFPLTQPDDITMNDFSVTASYLVTSSLRYISSKLEDGISDDAFTRTPTENFLIEKYIVDMVAQGLMGTEYTYLIDKNYSISYEELVNDTGGRLLKFGKVIAEFAVNDLGNIDGVLSIKNAYDNKFFNFIMRIVQEYYLHIAAIIIVAMAIRYLRGYNNLFHVLGIALIVLAGFQVYAKWVPTILPSLYNSVTTDITENIVWTSIGNQVDKYNETYANSNRSDASTGEPIPYTATITLYRMSEEELLTTADQLGVPASDIKSGKYISLDKDAGIFLKGNEIRMSLDKLFVNNSMRGLYQTQWDESYTNPSRELNFIEVDPALQVGVFNPYSIQLTNPYTSLESYYMPFPYIERAFLQNLNNFTTIFKPERRNVSYDGIYKDAFVVRSYIGSGIFLAPGNDEVLRTNLNLAENTTIDADQIITITHQMFTPEEDWLNMRTIFRTLETSQPMQESLWGRMLLRSKYYSKVEDTLNNNFTTEDLANGAEYVEGQWKMNIDKISDLIWYINDQTKKFVFDNYSLLSSISDENAIKLISLYATTAFTHKVSEFGYWVYPNYINTQDMQLSTVLYSTITDVKTQLLSNDGNVVNTVAVTFNFFGTILISILAITSAILLLILNYFVPILYALFGAILIIKLLSGINSITLIKGYIKSTGATIGIYILYTLGLKLVGITGYSWFGYIGCIIVTLFCLYILFHILVSVVTNLSTLGNDVLVTNLIGAMAKFIPKSLRSLSTRMLKVGQSKVQNFIQNRSLINYAKGSNIDTRPALIGNGVKGGKRYYRGSIYDYDTNMPITWSMPIQNIGMPIEEVKPPTSAPRGAMRVLKSAMHTVKKLNYNSKPKRGR